jgi:hypothetical protein
MFIISRIFTEYIKSVFDLPPNMPDAYPLDTATEQKCIHFNATHFDLPKLPLKAIRKVENGGVCTVSVNSNGTYDLGPMQINTIHMPDILNHYPSITLEDVACKPCLNITIGSWILKSRINEADGDVWLGVGNYHSKTPKVRKRYLDKIVKAVESILKEQEAGRK